MPVNDVLRGAAPCAASPICRFIVHASCQIKKARNRKQAGAVCNVSLCFPFFGHCRGSLLFLKASWGLHLRRISTASSTLRPGTIFCRCQCAAKCHGTVFFPMRIPKVEYYYMIHYILFPRIS